MKVYLSDNSISNGFISSVNTAMERFNVILSVSAIAKITAIYQKYSTMELSLIGDWDNVNQAVEWLSKYVEVKTYSIAEMWLVGRDSSGNIKLGEMDKISIDDDLTNDYYMQNEQTPINNTITSISSPTFKAASSNSRYFNREQEKTGISVDKDRIEVAYKMKDIYNEIEKIVMSISAEIAVLY